MIYTVYAEKDDMTFIMMESEKTLTVVGFYFGRPDADSTKQFTGHIVASFDPQPLP